MAISRISGNQISDTTQATITSLGFIASTGATKPVLSLPSGDSSNRPSAPPFGTLRFNTALDNAEIYVADDGTGSAGWTAVAGGGPSLGEDSVIRTNNDQISETLTVGSSANNDDKYTNGFSSGPIEIVAGNTVTIESGASWSII